MPAISIPLLIVGGYTVGIYPNNRGILSYPEGATRITSLYFISSVNLRTTYIYPLPVYTVSGAASAISYTTTGSYPASNHGAFSPPNQTVGFNVDDAFFRGRYATDGPGSYYIDFDIVYEQPAEVPSVDPLDKGAIQYEVDAALIYTAYPTGTLIGDGQGEGLASATAVRAGGTGGGGVMPGVSGNCSNVITWN